MAIFSNVITKQQQEKALEQPALSETADSASSQLPQQIVVGTSILSLLENHPLHKDIMLVKDMANTAWPGLIAAQSFFLTANLDEELFQSVLRAYQNFAIVCGVLHLTTPSDAFLVKGSSLQASNCGNDGYCRLVLS